MKEIADVCCWSVCVRLLFTVRELKSLIRKVVVYEQNKWLIEVCDMFSSLLLASLARERDAYFLLSDTRS